MIYTTKSQCSVFSYTQLAYESPESVTTWAVFLAKYVSLLLQLCYIPRVKSQCTLMVIHTDSRTFFENEWGASCTEGREPLCYRSHVINRCILGNTTQNLFCNYLQSGFSGSYPRISTHTLYSLPGDFAVMFSLM